MSDDFNDADPWDPALAMQLPGKMLLVGLSYFEAGAEAPCDQQQVFGQVVHADARKGILLSLEGQRLARPSTSLLIRARSKKPHRANTGCGPLASWCMTQTSRSALPFIKERTWKPVTDSGAELNASIARHQATVSALDAYEECRDHSLSRYSRPTTNIGTTSQKEIDELHPAFGPRQRVDVGSRIIRHCSIRQSTRINAQLIWC